MSDQKNLSTQRKMQLKSLLLAKAKDELQKEAERKAARKKEVLGERITPLPDLSGMDDEALKQLLRDIHSKIDKIDVLFISKINLRHLFTHCHVQNPGGTCTIC